MARTAFRLIVAIMAAFWCTQELHAQYGGGGGGMGGGGGGAGASSGSGFGSSSSAFSSSSSAFSSAGTGSNSSFSSSGFGSGFSGSGFSGGSGSAATGGVGIGGAQSMYGLRAGGAGATTPGMGNYQSSQSYRPTTTGYGGASSRSRRGTNPEQTANQAGTAEQVWFEPRVEVGFPVSLPPNAAIASTLANSFHSTALAGRFGGVQVRVEGNTAVLRGAVASVGDRELAAQMALLEPSIYSIRNELTVGPPVPAAKPPAQ
jgi:hypothetical protein